MSIKVILKSPESIKLFMDKYFSQNAFTIDVSGEIKLEQETTDIAVDVFKLLLENNLVSFEHVEFSNTAESFPTTKTTEKKNKENKDKVLKNTAQSIKEQIYVLLCNIAPGKLTTTEIVEKLQLKYPSVSSALCQLYKDGKVDKEKKKYFSPNKRTLITYRRFQINIPGRTVFSRKRIRIVVLMFPLGANSATI